MATYINFRELREQLDFRKVLESYGVTVRSGKGSQHYGACPLPTHVGASGKPSFSADVIRGIWRCFRCKASGNLLDFAVRMEGLDPDDGSDVRRVALALRKRFLDEGPEEHDGQPSEAAPTPQNTSTVLVNAPLSFELKGLDPDHPFFAEHGIKRDTAVYFGAGFCDRGMLKGRVAIPIHDVDGQLVGYAGRRVAVDGKGAAEPLYRYPESREQNGVVHRFDLTRLVYNAHRIRPPATKLFIADDYLLVWHLWELGVPAVSIATTPVSGVQAEATYRLLAQLGTAVSVRHGDAA